MKLFISYSHDDKAYVKTLADALNDEDSQHDVWIDRKLFGGQEWWRAILEQIESCDCFICILSPLQQISGRLSQVEKTTIGKPTKSIRPRNSVEGLEDGINESVEGLGLGAT